MEAIVQALTESLKSIPAEFVIALISVLPILELRGGMLDPTDCPDTDSYIEFLQNNIIRATGLGFPLPQGDTEGRARTIFGQLAKVGALVLLEG